MVLIACAIFGCEVGEIVVFDILCGRNLLQVVFIDYYSAL